MIHDIIGEWELILGERGAGGSAGRILFMERDGRIAVKDADPDATATSRVEIDGETIRFELLSAGSSRGNTHHNYELRLQGRDDLTGTRRRGLLAKIPLVGRRAGETPVPADEQPVVVEAMPASLAEAKARAAEAAERASLAAAEAAAALAEAEAAAALEAARRAAERAVAARAAVHPQESASREPVAPAVLATLPAPSEPPAFVPMAPVGQGVDPAAESDGAAAEAPRKQSLGITHRLSYGDSTVLAAEAFPDVFVWGGSFAAPGARLREAGWEVVAIDTEESTEVDELLIRHAAMLGASGVR